MTLANSITEKIAADVVLQAKIATATGKTIQTVGNWLTSGSLMLTSKPALMAISEHLGVPESELFETKKKQA